MISATTPATLAAAFAAGLVVPVLTTTAGISGAVILLPFELVVLRLGGRRSSLRPCCTTCSPCLPGSGGTAGPSASLPGRHRQPARSPSVIG